MIIDPASRTARRRAYVTTLRIITRLQKYLAPLLWVHLNRIMAEAANLVATGITNTAPVVDKHARELRDLLIAGYIRAGNIFIDMIISEVSKGTGPDEIKGMGEDFWRAFNVWATRHAAMRVVQLNLTTKRIIARSLKRSIEKGKSFKEAAEDLNRLKPLNKKRTLRIARTEMHTASVFAIDESVSSTRRKFEKEWNANPGKRTRPTHLMAHGQRVDKKMPFVVGGEKLMYPGDPKGSPGNIINCRCVPLYYRKR